MKGSLTESGSRHSSLSLAAPPRSSWASQPPPEPLPEREALLPAPALFVNPGVPEVLEVLEVLEVMVLLIAARFSLAANGATAVLMVTLPLLAKSTTRRCAFWPSCVTDAA